MKIKIPGMAYEHQKPEIPVVSQKNIYLTHTSTSLWQEHYPYAAQFIFGQFLLLLLKSLPDTEPKSLSLIIPSHWNSLEPYGASYYFGGHMTSAYFLFRRNSLRSFKPFVLAYRFVPLTLFIPLPSTGLNFSNSLYAVIPKSEYSPPDHRNRPLSSFSRLYFYKCSLGAHLCFILV